MSGIAVGITDKVVLGTAALLLEKQHLVGDLVEHFTLLLRSSLGGPDQSLALLPVLSEN